MKNNVIIIFLLLSLKCFNIYSQGIEGYERVMFKNRVIYNHILSHEKKKTHLFDFDTLESFEQIDAANKIMNAMMAEQGYKSSLRRGFINNLTNNECNTMYNHDIKVFYKLDANGNVYDVGFILKEDSEGEISKILFDKIVQTIESKSFKIDSDLLPTVYQAAASNGKIIWVSMMLPNHFFDISR